MVFTMCVFIFIVLFHTMFLDERISEYATHSEWPCSVSLSDGVMDCTAKHVYIKDVCKHVHSTKVKVLLAGENNFGRISQYDLRGCENLVKLDLHYNQIGTVSTKTFADFKYLRELDLRANQLRFYDEDFSQTVLPDTLVVLSIGGNWPGDADNGTYQYPNISMLKSLQTVYMDGFSADFGTEYRYLDIRNVSFSTTTLYNKCNISRICNTTLANLVSVTGMDLSGCSIKYISAGAFEKLTNLEILDLSRNDRLCFDVLGLFSYGLQFTNIRVLDYSKVYTTFGVGTIITKRHMCFFWNTSLTEMRLTKNRITLFETNALILTPKTLKTVFFLNNRPSFGPYLSQLGCLTGLEQFHGNFQSAYNDPLEYIIDPDSDENEYQETIREPDCPFITESVLQKIADEKDNCKYIHGYSKDIFSINVPAKLELLNFHECKMNYILSANLTVEPQNNSLLYMDFSSNNLYIMDGSIGPFPRLKILNLTNNFCSHIGKHFFDNAPTLEILILSENYLGQMLVKTSNVFSKLKFLKELYLESNLITTLNPDIFSALTNLERLALGSNNIVQFDWNIKALGGLLHIDLSHNFVRTFPIASANRLEDNSKRCNKSFTLNLEGNIIDFNCNNTHFLHWLLRHKNHVVRFENYTYDPPVKPKLTVMSLGKLDSSCRSYMLLILACSIGLTVFISTVIVGMLYRYRWRLRYFLYMSKPGLFCFKRHGYTEIKEYKYDAFVSYAEEDIGFIKNGIVKTLEEAEGLGLCIHQRDFVAGRPITDNIVDAVSNSRRTVVILSNVFLKKKWCMYEFNMARMEAIYSRDRNHLVVVILEHVPAKDMPLEMLEWIRRDSYIQYTTDEHGEALFWNKLKEAIIM